MCTHHSFWTVPCSSSTDAKTAAGSSQTHYGAAHAVNTECTGRKPRSDGGDPGSRPDPGTAANHPTGCNSHPWPWSTVNAGSNAQWPGPALPLHSDSTIIFSYNFSYHSCCTYKICHSPDPSNPDVNSTSSQSLCASPDNSLVLSPNTNDSPFACPSTCCRPNTDAKFSPHSSFRPCANPSHSPCTCSLASCSPGPISNTRFSGRPVTRPCTLANIHSCACFATSCNPLLHTGVTVHTSFSCTAPTGKICSSPSTKCRPTYVSETGFRLSSFTS